MSAKDRLPHEKGFHISWDQIHRDSRVLWRGDWTDKARMTVPGAPLWPSPAAAWPLR